jgi:hypothetical protein
VSRSQTWKGFALCLTWENSGSDVPIHLYSFSFNLNPDWTQALADQQEILDCETPETISSQNINFPSKMEAG